jgi:hypothetical protein
MGVAEDDGIVVDIDDPAFRGSRLRDLVHVVGRGQAGADVQELADARLGGEEPDRAAQEVTIPPRSHDRARLYLKDIFDSDPVSLEVVLSPEQRVIYPRHVGDCRVERPRHLSRSSFGSDGIAGGNSPGRPGVSGRQAGHR